MSFVILAAFTVIKYLFYLLLALVGLSLTIILGLRLWMEPIKGVCQSKAKLNGKTALVTGGNAGIGLETARDLARRGAKVIIASRDEKKSMDAVQDIIKTTGSTDVEYLQLDLAEFNNIRKFAEVFNRNYERLDILVNNAGCAGLKNRLTEDGIDIVMQVNYFGPFLLTNLLLPKLISSKPSRIVILTSLFHVFGNISVENFTGAGTNRQLQTYANSKLCDVLWTRALAKRLPSEVTVNCLHPGAVKTDIFKRLKPWLRSIMHFILTVFFKTAKEGAQTSIHLCVSEELDNVSGKYFVDCKQCDVANLARNDNLVEEVWNKSMFLTKSPVIPL
ncbi:hypothetical protein O3G_MSEX005982 [Manduca sexta]|uniref:RDH13 n=1 Tax=Manduca sexta TaxID=7130 RepID=A0A921Z0Y0_MANSE|nr:hypothetical protein O3G_MSEX005982 [Manduca sexta]